jgi:hypothetical protein
VTMASAKAAPPWPLARLVVMPVVAVGVSPLVVIAVSRMVTLCALVSHAREMPAPGRGFARMRQRLRESRPSSSFGPEPADGKHPAA